LVQNWIQSVLEKKEFQDEIKQLKENWDKSSKDDLKKFDPSLFKTTSGLDYTID
jgi:hypothetical protein